MQRKHLKRRHLKLRLKNCVEKFRNGIKLHCKYRNDNLLSEHSKKLMKMIYKVKERTYRRYGRTESKLYGLLRILRRAASLTK